jgi:hypothetical protein
MRLRPPWREERDLIRVSLVVITLPVRLLAAGEPGVHLSASNETLAFVCSFTEGERRHHSTNYVYRDKINWDYRLAIHREDRTVLFAAGERSEIIPALFAGNRLQFDIILSGVSFVAGVDMLTGLMSFENSSEYSSTIHKGFCRVQ